MAKETYLINEAAKEVHVEAHVLRYWEDELKLPIKRNPQGHRIYTREDIDKLLKIKDLKDKGMQLKAVKAFLPDNAFEIAVAEPAKTPAQAPTPEQTQRLQYLFQKLVKDAVAANNDEMIKRIAARVSESVKDDVCKELDYQFRLFEERDEERAAVRMTAEDKRSEEYYKRIDELLGRYRGKKFSKKETEENTISFPLAEKEQDKPKPKKEFRLFKKTPEAKFQ